jgi:hypothetical protein
VRIVCEKGFYKFYPQEIGQVQRFQSKFGADLVQCEDFFTFTQLAALPKFSILGQVYSGLLPGLTTYAGRREDVMAANGYSYYPPAKRILLKSTFAGFRKMDFKISNFIIMDHLPEAYHTNGAGLINGFHGFVDVNYMRFKIERFFYENF